MNKKNTVYKKHMKEVKVLFYKEALIQNGLDVEKTANALGVKPGSLRTMLSSHGISMKKLASEVCRKYAQKVSA